MVDEQSQNRSPAGLPGAGIEIERHNEICSLHNALTGDDATVAKVGLQIIVSSLVFVTSINGESTDSSLPLETSYLQ